MGDVLGAETWLVNITVAGDNIARRIEKLTEEWSKRKTDVQAEADLLNEEVRRMSEKQFTHIGESMYLFISIPKHLSPLIDEITIAMKRELGLPVDEDWYKGEMKKRLANILKVADGWIEKLDVTEEQKQWILTGAHLDSK